ncbi:MAG TPA: hypothetical protein VMV07_17575 [Streptosporangiaceae bacterium]|nr:hypothetical protein [Streptosporangiaceae bacterium]
MLAGQGFGHARDHGLRAVRIAAPGLLAVVRRVVMQEHAGAQGG